MDTRLLKHYESELSYIREMGAEFAAAYPKIAARLGIEGLEVVDPYVERLLEGFAFLSARVQLELELQYPNFTSNLLEIVYPHYLAPTPSMMIVSMEADADQASLKDGHVLPRHTVLRSALGEGEQTPCVFRTAQDLTLWPLEITEAEYLNGRGELVAAGIGRDTQARSAVRLRLHCTDGSPISELSLDTLTVFCKGSGGSNWDIHELLCTQSVGLAGRSTDRRDDWQVPLDGEVVARGFDPEDALLPTPLRSFDGYRLLQEYFGMPERFHFFDLTGLAPALQKSTGSDVDIYIMLKDGEAAFTQTIIPDAFDLHAVPAINLFPKRCDRVQITRRDTQQHVIADRTAPLDFEIFSVSKIAGISAEGEEDVTFRPFYSQDDFTAAGDTHPAYYTPHRRLRQRSEKERLRGVRTSYLGSETYVSLVDRAQAPFAADLEQLAVQAMCTNRDLPLLLPTSGDDVFHLPEGGPITSIKTLVSPTRPRPTLAQGDSSWRLISHLSLNYLSIADTNMGGGAEALREIVGIYAPIGDRALEKQLEGIVGLSSRPIVRRLSDEVLSTAVRGIEIKIEFDESFFEGTGVFVLGSVLETFFRRYVSINSFTETVLNTHQRGEIARWKAKTGQGRII